MIAYPAPLSDEAPPVISITGPVLSPEEEQEKWLAEGVTAIAERGAVMRQQMKEGSVGQVIRQAAGVLAELRTGLLAPQNYYELYIKAMDEMQVLKDYFEEEHHQRGRPLEELYETVQYIGSIVPRLYLLITAGAVYIRAREQPALDILRDLLEMCKGVQHPTRGLFLRHFLLSMMKGLLPGDAARAEGDAASSAADGGTVEDAADLLLQNFKEMNWLWIRMEARAFGKRSSQGRGLNGTRRTRRDRSELRVLVGMNIVRVSQLDGIDCEAYRERILPKLISIIVQYREPLAQQYLIEVIIQVFPDEFHLCTLGELIDGIGHLTPRVDVGALVQTLVTRLGNHVIALQDGVVESSGAHEAAAIQRMVDTLKTKFEDMPISYDAQAPHPEQIRRVGTPPPATVMPLATYVNAMGSVIRLTLRIKSEDAPAQISSVLSAVAEKFSGDVAVPAALQAVEKLLCFVVVQTKDINFILDLVALPQLTARLPFHGRRAVALMVCEAALGDASRPVTSLDRAASLFRLLEPLLVDQADAPADVKEVYTTDPAREFLEEQQSVCRVVHLLDHKEASVYLKMLTGVRKLLAQGGSARVPHTFPTLAALYARAALRLHREEQAVEEEEAPSTADGGSTSPTATSREQSKVFKAFHHLHAGDGKGVLETLSRDAPVVTFYAYITSAGVADTCGLPDTSYDLLAEAFSLYEENAADTRDQIEMLLCMINALCGLRNMPEEQYEVIATKLCQYSSKMVKKQDQSRMVAQCAALFAKKQLSSENQQRVVECLHRAGKLAGQVRGLQQLELLVDLLNFFLHYYSRKHLNIPVKYINDLLDLIREVSEAQRTRADEEGDEEDGDSSSPVTQGKTAEKAKPVVHSSGAPQSGYEAARYFYRSTVKYIRSRQTVDARWEAIEL